MIVNVVVINVVTIMVTAVTEHKDRTGNDSTVRDCVVITVK
jgi:hypothetical protein